MYIRNSVHTGKAGDRRNVDVLVGAAKMLLTLYSSQMRQNACGSPPKHVCVNRSDKRRGPDATDGHGKAR
eukprot:51405-Eustigmatos_ZCMA.PRE.1